jgi:hypothetical protein
MIVVDAADFHDPVGFARVEVSDEVGASTWLLHSHPVAGTVYVAL